MEIPNFCVECTMVFMICLIACSEGQQVDSNSTSNVVRQTSRPELPKCCLSRLQIWRNRTCQDITSEPSYYHSYFESNETHINNEAEDFNPTFYEHRLNCSTQYGLTDTQVLGIIYNGSIITQDEADEFLLIEPSQYCVDSDKDTIIFIACYDGVDGIATGQIYFPCLIISTLCYFISAIVYQFVLKVKDVHKKCFIGYSTCMGITFFCLILLSKVETGCQYIGSIFFLFILASFVWLCCLCLDMVYVVKKFSEENIPERIRLYMAASIMFPCLMLLISVVPSGIPDVPASFMKGQASCTFKESRRISILFVPMGLLLFTSIGSLAYTFYAITLNSKKFKSNIVWLEKQSIFKYMSYQCIVVCVTMSIFFILGLLISIFADVATFENGMLFSLQIIDSLQGLMILSVFVVHYFRRRMSQRDYGSVHYQHEDSPLQTPNGRTN